MRTPEEMMSIILNFAKQNSSIRIAAMEGSRVNKNISTDQFQDFDITYFVDSIDHFTGNDDWLAYFGNIIMMQKPEDMELFLAEEDGYSYLMLFDDYNKIDLTLLDVNKIASYLDGGDKLRTILLNKDGEISTIYNATDEDYWIKKPSMRSYDDCCNEFWNLTPYVVKGLCRKEILFAIDHLSLMRNELLRMLSWCVGLEHGFCMSMGKNYKFIDKYISKETWNMLLSTYRQDSYEAVWDSMFVCHSIFRKNALAFASTMDYPYPNYDANISKYANDHFKKFM